MGKTTSGRVTSSPDWSGSAPSPSVSALTGDHSSRDAIAAKLYAVACDLLQRQFWPGWTPRAMEDDPAALETHRAYASVVLEMLAGLDWQPISTAPRDGSAILVADARLADGFHQVVFWDDEPVALGWEWATSDGPSFHRSAFTHWRPLPPPPASGIDARSDAMRSSAAEGESPVGPAETPPPEAPTSRVGEG